MNILKSISFNVVILSGLIACTGLTPEANLVRTATTEQVASCEFLGPVSAFGAALVGGMPAAFTMVRNEVAERGGTHMVIINTSTTYNGYTHGQVEAEAFRCA